MDLVGFVGFWLDLRRISMDPWILEDVVGSGKDFYETSDLGRFWLDLGRISMDPWISEDLEDFGCIWEGFPWVWDF